MKYRHHSILKDVYQPQLKLYICCTFSELFAQNTNRVPSVPTASPSYLANVSEDEAESAANITKNPATCSPIVSNNDTESCADIVSINLQVIHCFNDERLAFFQKNL